MKKKSILDVFSGSSAAIAHFFDLFSRSRIDKNRLPAISESTLIKDLLATYPAFESFLQGHYAFSIRENETRMDFGEFTRVHSLPPAQILFMEFQLSERTQVRGISAAELKACLSALPTLVVLDVRESWERQWGSLPRSQPLDLQLLEEAMTRWPKDTPITVVCHFGVRSLDAAIYLGDKGFKDVRALTGGLEAWSLEADPTFPRYPGHPC